VDRYTYGCGIFVEKHFEMSDSGFGISYGSGFCEDARLGIRSCLGRVAQQPRQKITGDVFREIQPHATSRVTSSSTQTKRSFFLERYFEILQIYKSLAKMGSNLPCKYG